MQTITTDFLIIGSGLSGLYAAQHAARFDRVLIVTKARSEMSNSWKAQGGIAAAVGEDDAPAEHLKDSLVAGRGLCDHEAVRVLVEEGKKEVENLIAMGMQFDRDSYGELLLGLEGGHGKRRVLHAGGDSTGFEVTKFMLETVRKNPNIEWLEETMVTKLVVEDNRILGAQIFDFRTQQNQVVLAKAVILATGGAGALFGRTTNPATATGDGMMLAYQAGAVLRDMEFMQFHPTALSLPGVPAFLISEAVRGEGAYLVNQAGDRFMVGRHPLAELAPRDVVAGAIHEQLLRSGSECVYLKLDHLDATKIRVRFATIGAELKKHGIDMAVDPIPVAPAAHYTIGGVKTDLDGRTSVAGLYAVGEVASTGVHGANRLASNSLLECLVFGKRAALNAGRLDAPKLSGRSPVTEFFMDNDQQAGFEHAQKIFGRLMNDQVGIVRSNELLAAALVELESLRNGFGGKRGGIFDLRMNNQIELSKSMVKAAQLRHESRGAHLTSSFPDEGKMLYHTVQQMGKEAGREEHFKN